MVSFLVHLKSVEEKDITGGEKLELEGVKEKKKDDVNIIEARIMHVELRTGILKGRKC